MKNRAKTISLLLAVCMMLTLLPAAAFAVSSDWVAGGNGMKYRYLGSNFDIHGEFDGKEKSTTFADNGYRTYVRIGGSNYQVTAKPSDEMYTVSDTGLQVGIDLSFEGSGQDSYVNIKYTVKNTGSESVSFALGSGADIKIGNDDSAVITPLDTCNGFKMVSDNSSDSRTLDNGEKEYAQFNFFGSGEGVTDIDSYWYGRYGSGSYYWSGNYANAIFNYGAAESSTGNFDSAATWRWDDETIAADETKEYTVAIGIGGKGSEEAVVDEAVIDGTVTSPYSDINVELIRLSGNKYNVATGHVTIGAVTNNSDGTYSCTYTAEVPRGQYNVVAAASNSEGDSVTVTELVLLNRDINDCNITLPADEKSSIVANESDSFNAIVGGVDALAADQDENDPVTITLKVDNVAAGDAGADAIKAQAGDKLVDFVDLSLFKQVGDATPENIGDTNNVLLNILLKYDVRKSGIKVFRYHDDEVEELDEISAPDLGNSSSYDPSNTSVPQVEGFWIGNGFIGIRAKKFSTYAIAYDAPVIEPPVVEPDPAPASKKGIDLWYNGGNSFGSTRKDVPTAVEIDGVEVPFTGDGREFNVSCISPDAKWVTVRWNSTSVTVNFTPDANANCVEVAIPKTGDASVMAYALMAVIAAAGAMGKK